MLPMPGSLVRELDPIYRSWEFAFHNQRSREPQLQLQDAEGLNGDRNPTTEKIGVDPAYPRHVTQKQG